MTFIDPFFLLCFLPLTAVVFHLVGRRYGVTGALSIIMVASLLFYVTWGIPASALLVVSVIVNFIVGRSLLELPDNKIRFRIIALVIGQIYNFGTLIFFKYKPIPELNLGSMHLAVASWAIPAGISFYTFHQAAFLADAYAREPHLIKFMGKTGSAGSAAASLARYAAFVTFFPQLVIGPITYLKEFEAQLNRRFGRIRYLNFAIGFTLISIGMFKKVVLADHLATIADPVFNSAAHGQPLHPLSAWIGVWAYWTQLYFDFSGYSDMALGIARLFGIRYPINFYSPLKATGIGDYYRRWHMSLTRVISRFLFTPLSLLGTRFAMRRRWAAIPAKFVGLWAPLMINFQIIGLWHGATATFVLFGFVHGLWYVIEQEVRTTPAWKSWKKRTSAPTRALLGRLLFVALMPLSQAIFRSESIHSVIFLASQLVAGDLHRHVKLAAPVTELIPAFAIIFLLPNSIELIGRYRGGIMTYANPSYGSVLGRIRWQPDWKWAAYAAALMAISLYTMTGQPPFLYQGF